ncbi:hypothetical protein DOE78_04070 [Bacillus sp. Y1]|nr:hypothetical protein [Bacillus sp. Y1]AYA74697.1 hypothetical protein DOE78_04070 [Bacillus sp. Y1]
MQKLLFFVFIGMVLISAACNKEEVVTNSPTEKVNGTQKVEEKEKENPNELTFEFNGEQKTIPAKTKYMDSSLAGTSVKVTNNFESSQDPQGTYSIQGVKEYEGINVGFRFTEKVPSDVLFELIMYSVAGSQEAQLEEFKHPLLEDEYVHAMKGESDKKIGIELIKETSKQPIEITIQMFKPITVNQEEVLAEIIAMINTYKE